MIEDLKNVIKHGSLYLLGNMLTRMVSFLMLPIYTRFLTTADYGVLEIVTLVSMLLSIVFSLRLAGAMTRYYYEYKNSKDENSLVSTVQISVVIIAAVAAYLLSQNSEFISRIAVGNSEYSQYFGLISITLAFELCEQVPYTYLRILNKSMYFILMSLTQLVLGLTLNIYFIVYLKQGVIGVLYSMIISHGIVSILLVGYTFWKVKFGFDVLKLKKLFKFGLPFIPASLLIFVLNMGDRFLLARMTNLSEVGIYALGYKFGMLVGEFIGGPFSNIWGPKRVEIYVSRTNGNEMFSRIFIYLSFLLVVVGLGLSVIVKEILMLIAAPEFWSAYRVVPFVIIGYAFYTLYYVVDIGFYVKDRTFWYPIINAIAVAVNVGLNLILIPRYGALGAGMVTAISFFICPVVAFVISQRYLRLHYDFIRIAKLVSSALLFYWISSFVSTEFLFANIVIKMVLMIAYIGFLYLIRFFEPVEIRFVVNRVSAGWKYLRVGRSFS
jgi:O-antigen/teichoic acid export membrane protein